MYYEDGSGYAGGGQYNGYQEQYPSYRGRGRGRGMGRGLAAAPRRDAGPSNDDLVSFHHLVQRNDADARGALSAYEATRDIDTFNKTIMKILYEMGKKVSYM